MIDDTSEINVTKIINKIYDLEEENSNIDNNIVIIKK